MKALTLHQPWASLVAHGVKTVETRSWETKYRGPLLIHAAKAHVQYGSIGHYGVGRYHGEDPFLENHRNAGLGFPNHRWPIPLGAIVASCRLVDCVPIVGVLCSTDMQAPAHCCGGIYSLLLHRPDTDPFPDGETERDVYDQLPYGDFTPGRYAWLLDDIEPSPVPIPVRGAQRLWNYDAALPTQSSALSA